MVPIKDPKGRVIAFGGQSSGTGEPKYLNSPDTFLFDKGRVLFNLDRAAPASRQTGRNIVAEGYFDVIALDDAGIREAVAPMGTALPMRSWNNYGAWSTTRSSASTETRRAAKRPSGLRFEPCPAFAQASSFA